MNTTVWQRITTILLFLAPLLFAVNVVQSYRFSAVERRIAQDRLAVESAIEANKRLIAGIASLQSPTRIRSIADEQLEMRPVAPGRIIRLSLRGEDDGS